MPRSRRPFHALFDNLEPRLLMTVDMSSGAAIDALISPLDQPGLGHPAQLSTTTPNLTLSEIHKATGVEVAHSDYGLTGAGQTVVVIDSGIAYDHEALGGGLGPGYRVVGGRDFTEENDSNPYDDGPAGFHGTHVAGIIGSSDEIHSGVAPDADIVALRVFNDQGRGKLSWLESSLNWVIDNIDTFEHPITTVNMSIGTAWNSLDLPDYAILENELEELTQLGVLVSVAAGNRFSPAINGLSYPAVSPHVVPAASASPSGRLSTFSQRNTGALVVPGEEITSTVPDYLEDFNGKTDDFYAASGTSMAAPYLAGASMLVRQAMQRAGWVNVDVETIRKVLFETANEVYDSATHQSYRHINVAAAVELILGASAVRQDGSTFVVLGTTGNDEIRLDQFGIVYVNGEKTNFASEDTDSILITGNGGNDRLIVHSRFAQTNVSFSPGEVRITSPGHAIEANGFERIDVHVGAEQATANFVGSSQRDDLFVKSTHSWMESGRYVNYIRGAVSINGWANDSSDTATLFDTSGSDSFVVRPTTAALTSQGFTTHVYGYSQVVARAINGGHDDATIVGSDGIDVVCSTPDYTSLRNESLFVYVQGFDQTQVVGNGGQDAAKLYDSSGDDYVTLESGRHSIETPTTKTVLHQFTRVEAYASLGHDTAEITGTSLSEKFTAKPTHSWMELGQTLNYVRGFEGVSLHGGGGSDSARLYDSVGDDHFDLGAESSSLAGYGFQYRVEMIPHVHAVSRLGFDVAEFTDSDGVDKLFATSKGTWMKGVGFTTVAEAFDQVLAESHAGHDQLVLEQALAAIATGEDESWFIRDDDIELIAKGFRR